MNEIIQSNEKDNAIKTLRASIIKSISETSSKKYLLSKLLWGDAAKCFTDAPFNWDCVEFFLDLENGNLFAETSTYPNQFGASRESTYHLTPTEFHQKVTEHGLGKLLLNFESREDWDKLFDDKLKDAILVLNEKLKKEELKKELIERRENAVKIPMEFLNLYPAMSLSLIKLHMFQMYAVCTTTITIKNGKYFIEYIRSSRLSSKGDHYSRELSPAESVWLEKAVESTLLDNDESTWHSLPGGDKMDVLIINNGTGKNINKTSVEPITKFSNLMNTLEKLAQYGSITTSKSNDINDDKMNDAFVDEKRNGSITTSKSNDINDDKKNDVFVDEKRNGSYNGMCIAGFILSIFGCFLLPGVLSIIFGIIGLKQVRECRQKGKTLAIVGIVLGVICMVVTLAFL